MTTLVNKRYPFKTIHENAFISNLYEGFFNEPTFTRKISIDQSVLANKENYSIWELPNGKHEVRVQYSNDTKNYHRATIREDLEDAKKYIDEQIEYHSRQIEFPKKVWDGSYKELEDFEE